MTKHIDDSDDDLDDWRREEMDDDQEHKALMEFVFGCESDQEDREVMKEGASNSAL